MDISGGEFFLQIFIVDAPDPFRILNKRIKDKIYSVIFSAVGEAYISGGLDNYRISGLTEDFESADYTAQYAVLITDTFRSKSDSAVALFMPAYDGVIIGFRRLKIAVSRVRGPLHDCLRYRGNGGKIHIRHPHGNYTETVLHPGAGKEDVAAGMRKVYGNSVFSQPVHDSGKIIFHKFIRLSEKFLYFLL